jgi:hypothetical protein
MRKGSNQTARFLFSGDRKISDSGFNTITQNLD